MDDIRAGELLREERTRTQALFEAATQEGAEDRSAANEPGDMFDSAEPLAREGADDSVIVGLQSRLAAIERAEKRLKAGTYGHSVKSGKRIPDERLEADPAAELTVDEARQADIETP